MKWINERGAKCEDNPVNEDVIGSRYIYDTTLCPAKEGWKQYDTDQDAWYFGVWVNIEKREIVTYAEGDEIIVNCPTQEVFEAELQHMAKFYGTPSPAFTFIDERGQVTEIYDEDALFGREVPK